MANFRNDVNDLSNGLQTLKDAIIDVNDKSAIEAYRKEFNMLPWSGGSIDTEGICRQI